jgi:bifunctional DNA-binding transcriptional regulator/antitoxin component of YhaV-PrlF toxin-antitoxin module
MSKVTSKLQVTIPKALAELYAIRPGDEITWVAAGDSIRVIRGAERLIPYSVEERLELFDQATARQCERQTRSSLETTAGGRGWTREALYERGSPR